MCHGMEAPVATCSLEHASWPGVWSDPQEREGLCCQCGINRQLPAVQTLFLRQEHEASIGVTSQGSYNALLQFAIILDIESCRQRQMLFKFPLHTNDRMIASGLSMCCTGAQGLQDQHPRVRWAACQALGQMCTDLGPDIQVGHSLQILCNRCSIPRSMHQNVQ